MRGIVYLCPLKKISDIMPQATSKTRSRTTYDQSFADGGHVPPQALALEESVLGALMLDQMALINVVEILRSEFFYAHEHQVIYEAIRYLFDHSQPVDLLTVVNRLRNDGKLEEAGGAYAVAKLTENVVSAAHIEFHVRVLSEKFIQRELIRLSNETIKNAYDETTDVVKLLDDTEQKLMDINDRNFRSDYKPLSEFVATAREEMKKAEEKTDGFSGLGCGFTALDRMTTGFQPGTLIILAARPAMGKTACALSMARNMAIDYKKPVAIFSLEMTGQELALRLLSAESQIEGKVLKMGHLKADEQARMRLAAQTLSDAPIYIDDTPQLSIFELRAKARRLKDRFGIQMIFIDYLQLMTAASSDNNNRNSNREQEISMISRQLKALSKELGIPVLAMSQLNRTVEGRNNNIPQLSDLRESGAIEQDADIVIFIYRPEYYGINEYDGGESTAGKADLIVAKHRSGETGTARVMFEKQFARFMDVPQFSEADYMSGTMPSNTQFDNAGGGMIVDSKMNEDIDLPTDEDAPF